MKRLILAAVIALWIPTKAAAEPISATIAAVSAWAGSSAIAGFIVRTAAGLALSALGTALKGRRGQPRQPGIKTEVTTAGGVNPQSFILGRYATSGNRVSAPYSGPNSGDVPNRFLTFVVDLSDLPVTALSRVIVNGDYVTDLAAGTGGRDLVGAFKDGDPLLAINFHDGTQTAADPYMIANHAGDPARPWQSDMIGRGVAYAVLTFTYDRETWNGLPQFRFEVDGIPLYDPRADSSVGGSGAQRWADPATWGFTQNPMVMIYNILRGISLPDGNIWGGRVAAEDLPLAAWFAAMNECDATVNTVSGGAVAQYIAGLEVSVDQAPADVIDTLKNACAAEIVEVGGVYKPRVGPPAMPVHFFTDDDISVDDPRTLRPHLGLDAAHNAIHASHPAPEALWDAHDVPPRYNAEWEAQDGRRLVASINLPAVARAEQVQRLMAAWIKDDRRMRRHDLTLPPEAAILEPLDSVAWTSARNGYASKVFEVAETVDDLVTCNQGLALRERDENDFNWIPAEDEVPVIFPGTGILILPVRVLPLWRVEPAILSDDAGTARRAGLQLLWDGTALQDATAIRVQVRILGETDLVTEFTIGAIEAGAAFLFDAIIAGVHYEARARLVSTRETQWTAWADAIAPEIGLTEADFDQGVRQTLERVDLHTSELRGMADQSLDAAIAALGAQQSEFGRRGEGRADITREVTTLKTADEAIASEITTFAAGLDAANAAIVSEQSARVTADEAIASDVTGLRADVDGNTSQITNLSTVKVDANGAIAAVESTISAEYGTMAAMASATSFAEATAQTATGGFVLSATASGSVVSLSGAVRVDAAGASYSKIEVDADHFRILGDLSAYGANLGSFTSGASNGARTEITGPVIKVYNSSNQLVVAIGNLTGLV